MRAIVIKRYGGPEVLALEERPDPKPEPGHVLIEVRAFGLNHAEIYFRKGAWGDVAEISGIECAGVVRADPDGRLKLGQRVVAMVGGLGRSLDGSYAELTNVPAKGHALIKRFRFDRGCDSKLSDQGSDSMGRYDLTDFEWAAIQPVLPNKPRGVPRVDDRRVLNGIFWRLRSGAPWADIPEHYGPYTTCYNRFVRWRKAGVWDRLMHAITKAYDGDIQTIDSSSVRVHQHAANGKRGVEMIAWVVRAAG